MADRGATSIPLRRLLPALAVTAALGLGACGGEPAAVVDRDGTLRLTLSEYRIDPQVIRVRPGRIHIVARNEGRLPHNLRVRSLDRERGEEVEEFGQFSPTAFPGGLVTGDVVLQSGKYELVCTLGNHDDLGQTGTLIVGDGS
ncbi:hypothetical protein [Paraconexibacter algicola]|uniref:EfeO-type cupredoxin-like domain-containing protein n=1 Tax=Paraconexibacter algicola TaxID=2133960 RepID=A0A2T4UHC4_9ACTN|nr:hypothetical protein [Paraconexibacter algicola]PTL58618.1 hypothetical protein C7Y72_02575 [Paraconexibacter algicola]